MVLLLLLSLIFEFIFELSSIELILSIMISCNIFNIKNIWGSLFLVENILLRVFTVTFSPFEITFLFMELISYSMNSYSCNILVVFSTILFNLLSCC